MTRQQRYFIQLSFKGTNYHGWQYQENAETIQGIVENVLSKKLSEKIAVVGAGRTDTGVHAIKYIAHFDSVNLNIDKNKLVKEANKFLPSDIAIHDIYMVNADMHARFNATLRSYEYYIQKVKNPFKQDTAYYCTANLDIDLMNQCAQILQMQSNFESFCKAHSDNRTFICKISHAKWIEKKDQLIFQISADRFLRNMVRAIVGTLLDIGRKKISIDEFQKIIESRNRSEAGVSAPAKGLFLTDIKYPKHRIDK